MKTTLLILFVLVWSSCAEKYDKAATAKIDQTVKTLKQEKRFTDAVEKIYFVNIDAGCESCIDECLTFIKKEQHNNRLLFVIESAHKNTVAKVSSQYSLKIVPDNCIVIDNELVGYKNGLVDVFPKVFYVKNKKVMDTKSIDASNIDKLLVSN
ncbi:hypothetical protein [Mucilaginibacter sp. L3T2-6]|uniref:hypothetical protein n=1 Tax=Mucilaginibacter sp. L3T2-6 TaxID=3062491 RepID=UPI0026763543|nr:hypothetical protein [Mucilaginibacter sp. L3T2-6]MDO3641298.1 hypothetical protein [Mucilaginibacter sp. L3T2-6]MDV6213942.1 hypothetical protein [Mucilaginibacter sp. L3T2-6]